MALNDLFQDVRASPDSIDQDEDFTEQREGLYHRFPSRTSVRQRSLRSRRLSSAHSATQPVASGSSNFEAESPDELALVSAAHAYGCDLVARSPYNVKVHMPGRNYLN